MGGNQSKGGGSLKDEVQKIAAEYITTPSFTDMQNLSDPAYCNNLVILTSDILNKHLTKQDVLHLSDQIKTKESFIFAKRGDFDRLASEMDTKKKNEVCRGIAKFYIKIAHLFSAIKGTVSGTNLCSRRADALINNQNLNGENIIVNPNYCNMNVNRQAPVGTSPGSIHLNQEAGIPELEQIYYDVYDYDLGKFTSMSKEMKKNYEQDLKRFYTAFTGSVKMPATIKKFGDIQLHEYHRSPGCTSGTGEYTKQYVGTKQQKLFKQYADHVNQMLKTTSTNQNKLLGVLSMLFSQTINKTTGKKEITIHPELTDEKLQQAVEAARKIIVALYLKCEQDFVTGLKIFEAIVENQIKQTDERRIENLQENQRRLLEGNQAPIPTTGAPPAPGTPPATGTPEVEPDN